MNKKPIEKSAAIRAQVLAEYQNRALTTDDIAKKYGVSISTITMWANSPLKNVGFSKNCGWNEYHELP